MKTKLIQQKLSDDCGVAALAMLYDTSYTSMRKTIMSSRKGWDGTTIDHARYAGALFSDPVRLWLVNADNRHQHTLNLKGRPAVLVVPAKDKSGDWHAVYWDGRTLYDPSPQGKYGAKGVKALKTFIEAWVLESDGS